MMNNDNPTPSERYWLCPLYSFDCDCESVDLAEGIQIKPTSREFKDRFAQRYTLSFERRYDPSAFDWLVSILCSEAIEGRGLDNSASGAECVRAFSLLVNFVTACRLYQKGNLAPGLLLLANPEGSVWPNGIMLSTYLSKDGWAQEPKYVLHQSDVPKINELIDTLNNLRDEQDNPDTPGIAPTSIAIRRFNSSYQKDIEDRLIDQMIAFESLYIADDKELGYKLRLRTAFLLGEGKKQILKDMKEAYDLRGQIVHGGKKVKRAKLEAIVPKTEEYLRQSIQRFLSLLSPRNSLKGIKDRLDENILKNGKLLAAEE